VGWVVDGAPDGQVLTDVRHHWSRRNLGGHRFERVGGPEDRLGPRPSTDRVDQRHIGPRLHIEHMCDIAPLH
jgi:hypothetical protein